MDADLSVLERRVRAEPGDTRLRLRLARAYGRAGRPTQAWLAFAHAGVAVPDDLSAALAAWQREWLAPLVETGAQAASRAAPWGWQWRDLRGLLAVPFGDDQPLTAFKLPWCDLPREALRRVADVITLQWVSLSGCQVDAALLDRLAGLPRLTYLELGYTGVGARDLERLTRAPRLEELELGNCPAVDDEALNAIVGIQRLRKLDLSWTAVTDEGLPALARAPALESLSLMGCSTITDHGLPALVEAPALRRLELVFCPNVSDGAVAVLTRAKPGLRVVR